MSAQPPDGPSTSAPLPAFAGFGIELEYAIVSDDDLGCLPVADLLLREGAGAVGGDCAGVQVNDVARGALGWSNEFVMHVVEIKNLAPEAGLSYLSGLFQNEVRAINRQLREWQARLMPTAMHPWMDPATETRLWPHDPDGIYAAYGRIFDIRTHGWANLQSMHINLPFADDAEFARLHAAVRLVLPIIPALAASSPLADGVPTGFMDTRMEVYRTNAADFPSIAGSIVPDNASGRAEYEETVLRPMYRAIAPYDPDGVLQEEWLNSRGAIARFDRNAIEIRVTDTQECPQADLAIAAAVIDTVHLLFSGSTAGLADQQAMTTARLAAILRACTRDADLAEIDDAGYLALFGYPAPRARARDLWRHLVRRMGANGLLHAHSWRNQLDTMLEHGPLARRILKALDGRTGPDAGGREHVAAVYRQLCNCLEEGSMFVPELTRRR